MEGLSPRKRRRKRTQRAILDAARRIIATAGPDALSMRELADRIDYSPAAIYEYFDSKNDIVDEVCAEGHLRLTEKLQRVEEERDPAGYLRALGLAYVDFAVSNPDFYRLMFATPPSQVSVEDMMQEGSSFPIVLAAVERGVAAGVFHTRPGFEALEIAYAVWAMVHGIAMLRITYLKDDPVNFQHADGEALRALYEGLRAP